MDGKDKHHSQDHRIVDLLARDAPIDDEETPDQRVARLTQLDASDRTWQAVNRNLDEQIKLTREMNQRLRDLAQGNVERSTLLAIKDIHAEVRSMRESSHVNEATLNTLTEVRDELRFIRELLQFAVTNSHAPQT